MYTVIKLFNNKNNENMLVKYSYMHTPNDTSCKKKQTHVSIQDVYASNYQYKQEYN